MLLQRVATPPYCRENQPQGRAGLLLLYYCTYIAAWLLPGPGGAATGSAPGDRGEAMPHGTIPQLAPR